MSLDPNSLFFFSFVVLVVFYVLYGRGEGPLALILRNRYQPGKLQRYYKKKIQVRLQVVKDISQSASYAGQNVNSSEIVAILSFMLQQRDINDVLDFAMGLTKQYGIRLGDEFFEILLRTGRDYYRIGLKKETEQLMSLGTGIAHRLNQSDWARQIRAYHKELRRLGRSTRRPEDH